MTRLIKAVKLGALAVVAAGGVTVMSASPASAYIACNRYGECWHVSDRYRDYPPGLHMRFFDDNWWGHGRRGFHMRERHGDDRGYFDHGRWRGF